MTSPKIDFVMLGGAEYDRAKKILDRGRHPGFIGRELFYRCATSGRAIVAVIDGDDAGLALVVKDKLMALNAPPPSRGVGSALMRHLQPKWVRAIEEKVGFFERLGYKRVGAALVGQNGKHAVQLLELSEAAAATASAPSGAQPEAAAATASAPSGAQPEAAAATASVDWLASLATEAADRSADPMRVVVQCHDRKQATDLLARVRKAGFRSTLEAPVIDSESSADIARELLAQARRELAASHSDPDATPKSRADLIRLASDTLQNLERLSPTIRIIRQPNADAPAHVRGTPRQAR